MNKIIVIIYDSKQYPPIINFYDNTFNKLNLFYKINYDSKIIK